MAVAEIVPSPRSVAEVALTTSSSMAAVEYVAVLAVQDCSGTSSMSVEATNKMLFPPVIAGEGPTYPRSLFATMKPLLTQP